MTLVELTYGIRRYILFIPLSIFFIVVFYMVITALLGIKPHIDRTYNPVFGKLKPIVIKNKIPYPANPVFKMENIKGRPETATDSAKIYFIPTENIRFGYIQIITMMAQSLGFDTELDKYRITDTTAIFENDLRKLEVNTTTMNFTYQYKYTQDPTVFSDPSFPDTGTIIAEAKNYLITADRYPPELAQGQEHVIYLKYDSLTDNFEVVASPDQANVVEVDFFRGRSPGLEFEPVTPKFHNSQNYVVMTYGPEGSKLIKAEVSYFDFDTGVSGEYPLKDGDQAYAELTSGNGIIVSAGQKNVPIIIRNMFLAYFDPDVYQPYLQPVYVFIGDDNFAAYVPAVSNEYIE